MLRLTPEYTRDEYHYGRAPDGYVAGHGPNITVEHDGDGYVSLTLDPLPKETFDDHPICRSLTSEEARELAAALRHYARESDRSAGLR